MVLISKLRGLWSKKEVSTTDGEQHDIYDTLTPKIVIDNSVKSYFDALDFAFKKHDVKNIAITGPYGAGKSTVILSYLKNNLNKILLMYLLLIFHYRKKAIKDH
ncbi:TPA: hypothetical protein U2M59_001607 [Providencia stuartii]|nr:hypothetical protein [Providencia stuartii]